MTHAKYTRVTSKYTKYTSHKHFYTLYRRAVFVKNVWRAYTWNLYRNQRGKVRQLVHIHCHGDDGKRLKHRIPEKAAEG